MRASFTGTLLFAFFGLAVACGSSGSSQTGGGVGPSDDDGGTSGEAGSPVDGGGADADAGPDTRKEPPVVHPIAGVTVDTFAGSGTPGAAEGTGAAAQFTNPVGIAIDDGGDLVVTEYDGGRVRKITPAQATSLVASGITEPYAVATIGDAIFVQSDSDQAGNKGADTGTIWIIPNGGPPAVLVGGLGRPRGLARLADGRLLVSDRTRETVSILDPASKAMTLLAGSGKSGFADGVGAAATVDGPYGAAALPDGSVVVADSGNHCIRKVTLAGEVSVFAGDRNPGMKDDPDKLAARFDGPADVAADAAGNVYVTDGGNHRIRRISAAGAVETVAGDGTAGFADGDGASAKFFGQEELEVSADGKTLYVTDGNGGEPGPYHRVRRIALP
jgi:sugar lactone lactonase YvrE